MFKNKWSIYLLTNGTRTYIGSTTDVRRRLRQHNGEIRGGARSTRGHKWEIVMYITGFDGRSSACRWEKIVKCRARGLENRRDAMTGLTIGICPNPNKKHYKVPEGLTLGSLE